MIDVIASVVDVYMKVSCWPVPLVVMAEDEMYLLLVGAMGAFRPAGPVSALAASALGAFEMIVKGWYLARQEVVVVQTADPSSEDMPIGHDMHIIVKSSATSLNTRSVVRPNMASALTVIVSPALYLW